MNKKKGINETKLMMENWAKYTGLNEAWVDRAKKTLGDYFSLSDKGKKNMPADGDNDDAIEIGDEDIVDELPTDRGEQLKIAHAVNFLKDYLNYDKFRKDIARFVREELKNALSNTKSQAPGSSFIGQEVPKPVEFNEEAGDDSGAREEIYRKTANLVLSRIEQAIKLALPQDPQSLITKSLRESLDTALKPAILEMCQREHKELLTESKKKLVFEIKR